MNPSPRDLRVWLLVPAVLAPLVGSVALVLRYGVDVPVGDQWSIASMFGRGWHLPPFAELLRQANESRPLFPKLLFIALANLGSAWDVRREMLVTQGLLALVASGLFFIWYRTIGVRPLSLAMPLVLVMAWLFSPAQYDNFLWGIQLIVYVPFACLTGVLAAVAAGWSLTRLLVLSAVLALIATFSYANGMMVWLFSVPAIAWAHWGLHSRRWPAWLAWAAGWTASAWVYFRDLSTGAVPSTDAVLKSPADALAGFLAYTGAVLSARSDRLPFIDSRYEMAIVAGSGVLAIMLAAMAYLLRARRPGGDGPLVLWGTVAGYGVLSGALTVVGRFSFGPEYMLTSRYVAFSNTVLIGTTALATVALRRMWLANAPQARALLAVGLMAGISAAGLTAWNARDAVRSMSELHRARLQAKAVLNFFPVATVDALHTLVYWSDTIVLERAPGLLRAGIRRDDGGATSYLPDAVAAPMAGCVETVGPKEANRFWLAGWSFLERAQRPADAILVTMADPAGQRPIAIGVPTLPRPDVPGIVGSSPALLAGWQIAVPVPFAADAVRVWAYDVERHEAYELTGRCPGR